MLFFHLKVIYFNGEWFKEKIILSNLLVFIELCPESLPESSTLLCVNVRGFSFVEDPVVEEMEVGPTGTLFGDSVVFETVKKDKKNPFPQIKMLKVSLQISRLK